MHQIGTKRRKKPGTFTGTGTFTGWMLALAFFMFAGSGLAQSSSRASVRATVDSRPVTEVVVAGGNRALLKIAVAGGGVDSMSQMVASTLSHDFVLSSLFDVLDPKSFTANPNEGMRVNLESWRNVGADAVVKIRVTPRGGSRWRVEMKLFVIARGPVEVLSAPAPTAADPTGSRDFASSQVRGEVHQFANDVIKWFTGSPGSFGARLVYSAPIGRGQRGIFSIDSDGYGATKLDAVSSVALAPVIGPGGVYYSAGLPTGAYWIYRVGSPQPFLNHPGLLFGVAFQGQKAAFVVSQGGQTDIYRGAADGTNLTKVTSGGLNTHPAFGPNGQLAYVSNHGGTPQIYVDGKRVSPRGTYNMAPVWCVDSESGGTRILFMGRDAGTWDIFSVDPSGDVSTMRRLTQDQGSNTYPACSPTDGRTVAFFSSRGGLYLSNTLGQNQQKIANVMGESLRWEGN